LLTRLKGLVFFMSKFLAGFMAAALAGVMLFQINMDVNAAGFMDVLPAGGVNIALSKGTAFDSLQTEAAGKNNRMAFLLEESEFTAAQVAEQKEDIYENIIVAQVDNYVNVRSLPGENGKIVGKLYDDCVGELLGEENGWYHILSGNVEGYVRADFCIIGDEAKLLAETIGTKLAKVNCDGLYVRKEASFESEVMRLAAQNDELLVLEVTEDWVKVDVEEGFGWVDSEYVDLHTEYLHAESKAEEKARMEARERARKAAVKKAASDLVIEGDNEMGVAVAEYAIQFVGNPYVWGGTSLTEGADCSGFVMKVYEEFGVTLPHSSAADRKQGYAVKGGLKNAQPGDLICYSGHVALYIGDGQIVHAASEKSGIKIGKADYRTILAVRRIF